MKKIGITGGVGAGKTAILKYLQNEHGADIVVADEVAHMLEAKGQPCYNELVHTFGADILGPEGEIDKEAFASVIYLEESALELANSIIHPAVNEYIRQRMEEDEAKGMKLFVVEAALLIENGYKDILDELWYVYTDEYVRRERLKESRGYSDEKIDRIMASQLKEDDYRVGCDRIIINNNDINETYKQIDDYLK